MENNQRTPIISEEELYGEMPADAIELTGEVLHQMEVEKRKQEIKEEENKFSELFSKKANEESGDAGIEMLIQGGFLPKDVMNRKHAPQERPRVDNPNQGFVKSTSKGVSLSDGSDDFIPTMIDDGDDNTPQLTPEELYNRMNKPAVEEVINPESTAEPKEGEEEISSEPGIATVLREKYAKQEEEATNNIINKVKNIYKDETYDQDAEELNVVERVDSEPYQQTNPNIIDEDDNDIEDWVSSYEYEGGITENKEEEYDNTPIPYAELAKYEIVKSEPNETIYRSFYKGEPVLTKVENKKFKTIDDINEFTRFLNKKKREYKAKMSVPLVNSGIEVEFVGAGSFDYTRIYATDPDRRTLDDIINRMKIMANNIISCEPKVNPNKLLSSISFIDYELATFGFITATSPELEMPTKCDNEACKTDFMTKIATCDLILNQDDLKAAWEKTLLTPTDQRATKKKITIDFFSGYICVEMSLATFEKVRRTFKDIQQYIKNNDVERDNITSLASVIANIESVRIDNTIVKDAILVFKFLNTLDEDFLKEIHNANTELIKDVVVPKFGYRAKCPKCGKEITVPVEDLEALVFFDLLVSMIRKMSPQNSTKNG